MNGSAIRKDGKCGVYIIGAQSYTKSTRDQLDMVGLKYKSGKAGENEIFYWIGENEYFMFDHRHLFKDSYGMKSVFAYAVGRERSQEELETSLRKKMKLLCMVPVESVLLEGEQDEARKTLDSLMNATFNEKGGEKKDGGKKK